MGMPLQIQLLANELRFSTTPVREALAFLAGQGVIEETRGSGYATVRLDARQLAQAYSLHGLLVATALKEAADQPGRFSSANVPAPSFICEEDAARLFITLVARSRNVRLARVHRAAALLLGRARLAEKRLFEDWRDELNTLADACDSQEVPQTLQAIAMYHQRRLHAVAEITLELDER